MTASAIIQHRRNVVFTASENEDFLSLSEKLTANKVGVIVIVSKTGELQGIVSERDLVAATARKKSEVFSCTAKEMMTRKVYVCSPDDTDTQLMAYMVLTGLRHLPVLDDGTLVGVVSLGDAVKSRLIKRQVLFEDTELNLANEKRGTFSRHLKVNVIPKVTGEDID